MTDKVTHYDYKAIPRTAFDKRAVKNFIVRLRNCNTEDGLGKCFEIHE